VNDTSKYSFTHRYVGYYEGGDKSKLEGYVKNRKFIIVGSVQCLCLRSRAITIDCVPSLNWLIFWQNSSISLLSVEKKCEC